VAVRTLCEFTAKRGDLDIRFTPSTSAFEGVAGHRTIANRRGSDYQRELSLQSSHGNLIVRGRADGFDAKRNTLEEYKTYRGDLQRMPANRRQLHWAQLKIYGALACRVKGLENIKLALVYFDVVSERETLLHAEFAAETLDAEFMAHCDSFVSWAAQELVHREKRDVALGRLKFPHETMGASQRELAESVYKTIRRSAVLMAQAPTGVGKTIGVLFPALKAASRGNIDKIIFLVAKTSGRFAAEIAINSLLRSSPNGALRILQITAKQRACVHPDRACTADSCPLAKGFYDRLPQARLAAIATTQRILDQQTVQDIALGGGVCPYYLAQELIRWSDVIIADYNYYFDTHATLHALTVQNQWRVVVLVDEAHNLLPRARSMYSATLSRVALAAAVISAAAPIKIALQRIQRSWQRLDRDAVTDYTVFSAPSLPLLSAIETASLAIRDSLAQTPDSVDPAVSQWYFDMLHFKHLADSFGEHSLFDLTRLDETGSAGETRLCIRNVSPATFLASRFSTAVASILFSATLSPEGYYRRLLGLPTPAAWVDIASAFHAGQLTVRVSSSLSTRYVDRATSISSIVEIIGRQARDVPGNYLAFFSSFDYLGQVACALRRRHPELEVFEQSRNMNSADRDHFLDRFSEKGAAVGFAVLGGIFAEGIDLPGTRLIGAFIATLGLPQVNAVNAELQQRMQALFGKGFEYAYLYPGLQKVVQAAGRVIRTTSDTGTLHLMDQRFLWPEVRELLPAWWQVQSA
jgi:DNA excision repair protein ERCC-2